MTVCMIALIHFFCGFGDKCQPMFSCCLKEKLTKVTLGTLFFWETFWEQDVFRHFWVSLSFEDKRQVTHHRWKRHKIWQGLLQVYVRIQCATYYHYNWLVCYMMLLAIWRYTVLGVVESCSQAVVSDGESCDEPMKSMNLWDDQSIFCIKGPSIYVSANVSWTSKRTAGNHVEGSRGE